MDLKILMSTMDKESIIDLNLHEKNISLKENVILINQCNSIINQKIDNVVMLTYREKGLSKSRNRALEQVKTGIGLIADDDVIYVKNYKEIIKRAYTENPDVDIITFQIKTFDGELFKNYPKKKYLHNSLSVLKVSSIEISFNIERIRGKNILFDEKFGLGSKYAVGEEAIFLKDCLDKGLKILYIPEVIVLHQKESTGDLLDENGLYYKGAIFKRIYGVLGIVMCLLFCLKKRKVRLSFLKNIFKGYISFKRKVK